MKHCDIMIIGAGVLGISLAYHLKNKGFSVIVVEKETSYAQHSSGKNAGMIRQLYRHPQLTEWTERSIREWPDFAKEKAFRTTGSIVIGRQCPDHHQELFETRNSTIILNEEEQDYPSVYCKDDGLLDPSDHVAALFQMIDDPKIQFSFRTRLTHLESSHNGWIANATTPDGKQTFRAQRVVNAAGAWLNEFLAPNSKSRVGALPYARHLFLVEGWEEQFMPTPDVGFYWEEIRHWYMRQWNKESRLVSICDRISATPETFVPKPNVYERVAQQLIEALPSIAERLRLGHHWHCFRTYTEDQLPIFGEDQQQKGLFWLAAFGGFGMSTSFAAAKDAADCLCGHNISLCPDFRPDRVQETHTSTT